jgi:cytochrome c-type biogenesis protein CcmH
MMIEFGVVAALLVFIAVAAILFPLLRRNVTGAVIERGAANLQLLRDQLSEIDADLLGGVLSADQYDSARADLERRVLDESQQAPGASAGAATGKRWRTPVVIGLLIPVFAVVMYFYVGDVDGLDVEAYMQREAATITPETVDSMVRQLAQRLEEEPDDVEGWAMLGRSYMALQRYPDSALAWKRAAELEPGNASILTNYAEATGLAAQGNLDGEPTRLLARALDADPSHGKALALSGGAAYGRGDYQGAIEYWQRLLLLSGDDKELSTALMTGIAEARARLGDDAGNARAEARPGDDTGTAAAQPGFDQNTGEAAPLGSKRAGSIRGVVSLSPQMSASANSGDTVFVFVRAAEGPRMPLAVARVKVEELPYDFHLDDSMAMVPDRKISDFSQVVVGARISGSGVATRSSGDLEGFSEPVEPVSSGIRVLIDRRVP